MPQLNVHEGFINVMEWAKLPISVDEFAAKIGAQRDPFKHCELLPGVSDLLDKLCSRVSAPLHLAIASSAERDFFKLKTDKFQEVLRVIPEDHRIFGDDAIMSGCKGKPAPDIFVQALKRINDSLGLEERSIEPLECLVFEDSTAGVEAGRRAGMRVAWVPHPGLLEVYKGREEDVLSGILDEHGKEPLEHSLESGQLSGSDLPVSMDGRAELVTKLEDFPYKHYGIYLQD